MEQILNLVIENKVIVGIIAIAMVLGGGKIKDFASVAMSKVKGVSLVKGKDEEKLDQDAIRRLRDRAAQFGDEALLKEIKAIDSKFYDIHAKGKDANV